MDSCLSQEPREKQKRSRLVFDFKLLISFSTAIATTVSVPPACREETKFHSLLLWYCRVINTKFSFTYVIAGTNDNHLSTIITS